MAQLAPFAQASAGCPDGGTRIEPGKYPIGGVAPGTPASHPGLYRGASQLLDNFPPTMVNVAAT